MMIELSGVPSTLSPQDLKVLIRTECKMDDFILGNLIPDETGTSKTKIGVVDAAAGQRVMQCLDGFRFLNHTLKVDPVTKAFRPPKCNFKQQANFVPINTTQNQPGPTGSGQFASYNRKWTRDEGSVPQTPKTAAVQVITQSQPIKPDYKKPEIPVFAMPCKHLKREMRPAICAVTRGPDVGIERKRLMKLAHAEMRVRLKDLMLGRGYMPTAAIMQLYRESYPAQNDKAWAQDLLKEIRAKPSGPKRQKKKKNKKKGKGNGTPAAADGTNNMGANNAGDDGEDWSEDDDDAYNELDFL